MSLVSDGADDFKLLWLLRRSAVVLSLATLTFAVIAVALAARFWPPQYTATATLALEPARQDFAQNLETVFGLAGAESTAVRTEAIVLMSRTLLGDVVDGLALWDVAEFQPKVSQTPVVFENALAWLDPQGIRLAPDFSPRDTAIDALEDRLDVQNPRQSFALEVTVTTQNSLLSAQIANALVETYLAWQKQRKKLANSETLEVLSTRAQDLRSDLEALENQRFTYANRGDVVDEGAAERLSARLQNARAKLDESTENYLHKTDQIEALNAGFAKGQQTGDYSAFSDLVRTTEYFTGRVRNAEQARAILNAVRTDLLQSATRIASAEEKVAAQTEELSAMSHNQLALRDLDREIAATQALYQSFLAEVKETSVERGLEQPDARRLSLAVPRSAVAPRLSLIALLGGLVGFALCLCALLLRAHHRNSVRTPEDLHKTFDLPVLGVLHKSAAFAKAPDVFIAKSGTTPVTEALRTLRTALNSTDPMPQVLGVTSSVQGEGKSTLALSLAHMQASAGARVLLIEADLRRPSLTARKNLAHDPASQANLAHYLLEQSAFELSHCAALGPQIWALPGGQTCANPADLLAQPRFAQLIAQARPQVDRIIVDLPPTLVAPDARLVSPSLDMLLYAVKWDHTKLATVVRGVSELGGAPTSKVRKALVITQMNAKKLRRVGLEAAYAPETYAGYHTPRARPFWPFGGSKTRQI
ncbi:MAG: Wzz/FepE/Etk N-terminal domain-containing protein [Pseudomonadota bacterium]